MQAKFFQSILQEQQSTFHHLYALENQVEL